MSEKVSPETTRLPRVFISAGGVITILDEGNDQCIDVNARQALRLAERLVAAANVLIDMEEDW